MHKKVRLGTIMIRVILLGAIVSTVNALSPEDEEFIRKYSAPSWMCEALQACIGSIKTRIVQFTLNWGTFARRKVSSHVQ